MQSTPLVMELYHGRNKRSSFAVSIFYFIYSSKFMCSLSFPWRLFSLLCSSIFVISCIYLITNVVHDCM